MSAIPWPCLMLVTEPSPNLREIVQEAILGGVNVVQWREKRAAGAGYFHSYASLSAVVGDTVPLVVNGPWESAIKRGAQSIHLPEDSLPVGVVRHKIGAKAMVGKSIHSVASAQKAASQGADYIVAGTIFKSSSHPEIEPLGLEFLQEVCAAVSISVIAIGGIKPENISDCLKAGAVGVAVLSPIMRAGDPQAVARQYQAALDKAWEQRK